MSYRLRRVYSRIVAAADVLQRQEYLRAGNWSARTADRASSAGVPHDPHVGASMAVRASSLPLSYKY